MVGEKLFRPSKETDANWKTSNHAVLRAIRVEMRQFPNTPNKLTQNKLTHFHVKTLENVEN